MTLENPSRTGPLRDRDMLCFSHDWSGDPLSKTHLMRLLARDNRVLWVNSIGYRTPTASARDMRRAVRKLAAAAAPLSEPHPNLFVLNPLIIPAHSNPAIRRFNRWLLRFQVQRAMRSLNMQRPINWVFNPAAALIAGTLGEDLLIYYCVDEYAAFTGVASSLQMQERELLTKADLVITSAEKLRESKRALRPDTVLVRHGVDWSHFRTALDAGTRVPEDLARLPGPVLGYFGLMAEDWVDVDLIAHVARQLPHVSIAMIGRQTMDLTRLARLPNVHLLGHRPYEALPAYCKGFCAAMIPFPISEVTLNANPLKAREYLAAGLPVVSTDIPEVRALGACRVAANRDEFVAEVVNVLKTGPCARVSESLRTESWEARLEEISAHIARVSHTREGHPHRRLAA